jgi:hypothetical protein
MGFDDGNKNRFVGIGVTRRRTVCFGVFGVLAASDFGNGK